MVEGLALLEYPDETGCKFGVQAGNLEGEKKSCIWGLLGREKYLRAMAEGSLEKRMCTGILSWQWCVS